MAKGIHLVSVDASTGNAVVQYNGDTQNNVTVQGAYNGTDTVIIPGWGTFKARSNTDGKIIFTGEAGLSGELNISIAKDAYIVANKESTLKTVDFRASSSGVQFSDDGDGTNIYGGTGNDTITVTGNAYVEAGAGNDIVKIDTQGNTNSVNLGAGADTLVITGGEVTVSDYNYYEGDVIEADSTAQLKFESGNFSVTPPSGSSDNYKLTARKVAVQDNWYAARVKLGVKGTIDSFSAVAGSNATRDFSKSTVMTGIDATKAKSANITLGSGDSGVLFSSGVDTVKVGKSSSTHFKEFGTDDIIAIDGVKLSDLAYSSYGGSGINIDYAATGITIDGLNDTIGSTNINDGSQTHKLAYALAKGQTLAYTDYSNADWFYGNADGSTTLEVGATTHLHDMNKYKNITKISVAASANLEAPISLTGAIGKDNSIDATHAKVGVATWGFSSGSDSITLGAGQDTVWFGAGDGTDAISGFKYGTASDSDVLYLKDTHSLKDIQPVFNTGGGTADIAVGKAIARVEANTVQGSSDVAQIKLADEKTYKVAGNYNAEKTVDINTDEIDGLDYYAFDKKQAQTVVLKGGKDWIVHSLYTDFYTTGATIGTIDAHEATGNVTLAAAADIKGGAGTNNIWTYQANASASVAAGTGTDIIWFAENADKDVHVTGFDADKDIVKFATAQSLKEIADSYSFATVTVTGGTNTAITGVNNTDSVLTLNTVKDATINLVDGNDKAYKALVMKTEAAGTTGEFSTDVNIYAGMTTLTAGGSIEGTVAVRLGKESRGLSSDTYFIDDSVTKFDGSKSTATFWIAGNANKGNEIIGGLTENYLYGGGASSDVLHGSIVAKDTFYFGTGDGVDQVASGLDRNDTIALWNIADADIANVKVTMDTDGTANIHLADSSTLKLTDANAVSALKNGLTFTSASQTAYTYDSESKTLVKKA